MTRLFTHFKSGCAGFCTALRFLTLLPVTWQVEDDADNFTKSLFFFPLVGLLIGVIASCGAWGLLKFLPIQVVSVLAICFLAFISGCLHLDGLADSGDGLFCARPRSESLRIMKDSRVGPMGVIFLVFILLGKYSAISTLGERDFCLALLFMPLCGRAAILFTMACLKYARPEAGLGLLFYSGSSRSAAILAGILLVSLLLLLTPDRVLLTPFIVIGAAMLFNKSCKMKFGGATGDTLGANCEIAETVAAFSFTISFFTS
jgi:adenosylcobinamide-GDP ribazoletransferase